MWLGAGELQTLIDEAQTPQQRIAFLLAGRCGLRHSELVQVRPVDFISGPTGHYVRVWEDYRKGEKYRKPPVSDELKNIVDTHSRSRWRWTSRSSASLEPRCTTWYAEPPSADRPDGRRGLVVRQHPLYPAHLWHHASQQGVLPSVVAYFPLFAMPCQAASASFARRPL